MLGLTLRGILVITTLLAVGIARLVGTKVKRARDEKAIASAILAAGGSVRYVHHGNAGVPVQEDAPGLNVSSISIWNRTSSLSYSPVPMSPTTRYRY